MDGDRFDELTITLGAHRRTVLRGLVTGMGAAFLGKGAVLAAAGPTCGEPGKGCKKATDCCATQCKKKKGKKKGKCTDCSGGRDYCNGVCCAAGESCIGGSCTCSGFSCPDGCCASGVCVVPTTDTQCGANGAACVACDPGQRCVDGACVCDATSCPNGCCDGATCRVDDDAACGAGGGACVDCPGAAVCQDGACACPAGKAVLSNGTCATTCPGCNGNLCPCEGCVCGVDLCGAGAGQSTCSNSDHTQCPVGQFCAPFGVCYRAC